MRSKASKQNSKWQNLFYSKMFFLCGIIVIIILIIVLIRDFVNSYEIKKKIQNKQDEIIMLEEKNKELTQMIEYLKSTDYVEIEAKKKLGLHKTGEKAVVISNSEVNKLFNKTVHNNDENNNKKDKKIGILEKTPNYQLWWNYFFN